jgi:preprotein translocase subunit SecG
MMVLPLLAVGILMTFVAVLFVLASIILVLVILVQKGRGGGLSGAFGGGMASGLLGSKTGDFLTWVTIILVAVWLGLAILMVKFYRPAVGEYGTEAPVTATQPVPADQPSAPQPAATGADVQPAPTGADVQPDQAGAADANAG